MISKAEGKAISAGLGAGVDSCKLIVARHLSDQFVHWGLRNRTGEIANGHLLLFRVLRHCVNMRCFIYIIPTLPKKPERWVLFSSVQLLSPVWLFETPWTAACHAYLSITSSRSVISHVWCEELTHLKRPWCWERLRAGGQGDDRGWDGWMASSTQWIWVWVNSGSWWWTGRPGVLQFMGSQRAGHDCATELNRWGAWGLEWLSNCKALGEQWAQN